MFKKSIAIIDDDPDLLNLFSEALQMSGYTNQTMTYHDIAKWISSFRDYNMVSDNCIYQFMKFSFYILKLIYILIITISICY